MFKPVKKLNENAVKKDFFKSKKDVYSFGSIYNKSLVHQTLFLQSNDLENLKLPLNNQIIFLTTKNARSIVNFIQKINANESYLFCSRLNEKSFNIIKDKNLQGIGLSNRVLENNPDFYKKVTNQTKVKLSTNHSKMLLFNKDDNYYVITGSGNASINSRIENYIIENNKDKYNQIKNFFENA